MFFTRYIITVFIILISQYFLTAQICEQFESVQQQPLYTSWEEEQNDVTITFTECKTGEVSANKNKATCLAKDEESAITFIVKESNINSFSFLYEQKYETNAEFDIFINESYHSTVKTISQKEETLKYSSRQLNQDTIQSITIKQKAENSGQLCIDDVCFYTFSNKPSSPNTIQWRDISFTEIFADPTPSIGLPEHEFIEIKNNTDSEINLSELVLICDDDSVALPNRNISPNCYAILTKDSASFTNINNSSLINISKFPALNNSGEQIALKTKDGILIDYFHYQPSLYTNEIKSEGGWSLEKCCKDSLCREECEWTGSKSEIGGTPGIKNLLKTNISLKALQLESICYIDTNKVKIIFSQPTNPQSIKTSFNVKGIQESVFDMEFVITSSRTTIPKRFTIEAAAHGNTEIKEFGATFGKPSSIENGDIVFSEILFSPYSDGCAFIELLNKTNKFIKTEDLQWIKYNTTTYAPISNKPISSTCGLIPPKSLTVFGNAYDEICDHYQCPDSLLFVKSEQIPLLKTEGIISLSTNNLITIDSLYYSDKMHSDILYSTEGVSLENISVYIGNKHYWLSCPETDNFATPGRKSSQITDYKGESLISLSSDNISINNDGINDIIAFKFNCESTKTVNICLFSANKLIGYLFNNATVSPEGVLYWDGNLNDLELENGFYTVYIEMLEDGVIEEKQKYAITISH